MNNFSVSPECVICAPQAGMLEVLLEQSLLSPFDSGVIDFIGSISQSILSDHTAKNFPELTAMAFWMRKAHILALKKEFDSQRDEKIWLPRGVIFHIAPANVDTMFIYSWFLSFLMGNLNIVRISSSRTSQLDHLIKLINVTVNRPSFESIRSRFLIVRYDHNDAVTALFSNVCDKRVIWGGDAAIQAIRKIPLPPTASDMVFGNKFSLSVIRANAFLELKDPAYLIKDFYNDAFWFDQMACSSPRLICWVGTPDDTRKAAERFWPMLETLAKTADRGIALALEKYKTSAALAIEGKVSHLFLNGPISRVQLTSFSAVDRNKHCGGGLFYEIVIESLEDVFKNISKIDQTLTIFGFNTSEITLLLMNTRPKGICRIVPIGKALDFDVSWDGISFFREFTREINILSQPSHSRR